MSADLYICETTGGVEYYNECHVSFELAILMGALYQLYRVMRAFGKCDNTLDGAGS